MALLAPCLGLQVGCSTTLGGENPGGDGAGAHAGTSGAGSSGASGNATGGGSGNATGGASGNATGGSTTGGSATGGGAGTAPVCMPGVIDPGRSPMRRLNGFEYDNTVHDLMGATKKYSTTWPIDNQAANSGFSNAADHLRVDSLVAEGFQKAAEEMAAAAVANLGALAPACNPTMMGAETCARSFIQAFGKKAFRRPLVDEELTRYLGLFTTGSTGATYNDGISLMIEAVLQSPNFLYRLEFGDPMATGNVVPLTSYELATRLSYFLWSTMPDAALFVAADANQLTTPVELAAQTERMLQNDHAKAMVRQFHREWLQVERAMMTKAVEYYPTYTVDLAAELVFEADRFMEDVYWNNGSLMTLLTAPYSFMNGALAQHYGVPGITGTNLVKVDLDPTQRSGILTLGGFLAGHASANQTSPIHRGKFVREHLLCQPVNPPPNDIVIMPPEVTATTTTRQRFEAHAADGCIGCHVYMDPIGFLFENFDGIGRWRDVDNGIPVDSSGEILEPPSAEMSGPINGAVELSAKLTQSPQVVGDCVALQWFRWGNGRLEGQEDGCSIASIREQFRAANYDMRSLPAAIVNADAFRYRKR